MNVPGDLELDIRELCARVLREYEEVIAQVIQRPVPARAVEPGPGVGALAIDGTLPSEPA